jgi:hypothetical protein
LLHVIVVDFIQEKVKLPRKGEKVFHVAIMICMLSRKRRLVLYSYIFSEGNILWTSTIHFARKRSNCSYLCKYLVSNELLALSFGILYALCGVVIISFCMSLNLFILQDEFLLHHRGFYQCNRNTCSIYSVWICGAPRPWIHHHSYRVGST